MSLFGELKRRNVFRVGIAYAVSAWLLLQVTDIILNNVEAPPWAFWLVLVILGIGLVLVLAFSWVFELTPEGIKREREIDRSQSITPQTGRKLDRLITGVLVLALAYFVIDKFVIHDRHDQAEETAAAPAEAQPGSGAPAQAARQDDKSIAVLPFVNMSDDASNEYFSDGISEEILNALAKVKELKVAGRTSSFAFKGQNQDLRAIAEALGVQHVLEGSVRKAGDTVRITAQLIKADDGFHLWSETYDRRLDDVFAIQDEIANAILVAMKTTLLDQAASVVSATRTSAEAYELYLLAKQRAYERTALNLQAAADLLDRAIALDPAYAPAYAQRGIVNMLLSETSYGTVPRAEANAEAKRLLDRALELDPGLAEAWAGLGLYYNDPPRQPNRGVEVLEKALSINPNLNDAGNWLVLTYWGMNRVKDADALLEQITARDPLYRPAFANRVFLLSHTGRADQARALVDSVEPFMRDEAQISQARAWIDYAEGRMAAGLRRMEAGLEKQPTDRVLRVGVNQGRYRTRQLEAVNDDNWSDYFQLALLALGRTEEARILTERRAASGEVDKLFYFFNRTGQPEQLVAYLEQRWPSLEAFQAEFPPGFWGYGEMLDIALAYRRTGNAERFGEAMQRLREATYLSLSQGVESTWLMMVAASYHALAGEKEEALARLAAAIDGGYITPMGLAVEYPALADLVGDPEFEAIQARMIEHLNRERQLLGLGPVDA